VAGRINAAYSEGLRNKVAEPKERGMPARRSTAPSVGTFPPSIKRNAKMGHKAEGCLLRRRAPRRTPHREVEQGEKASR
jgi:hypothetical protein